MPLGSALIWCSLHSQIQTFQNTNLVHNSFNIQQYICYITLLNMFIRRTNCITTASGIVTLCKKTAVRSPPAYCTAAYRGDDTRGCGDTIDPPDDEQRAARNMLRSVV